jgi:hypothetical protein
MIRYEYKKGYLVLRGVFERRTWNKKWEKTNKSDSNSEKTTCPKELIRSSKAKDQRNTEWSQCRA